MTDDDVVYMGYAADEYADAVMGCGFQYGKSDVRDKYFAQLVAKTVAAQTREECAEVVLDTGSRLASGDSQFYIVDSCAAAIREKI